MFRQAFAAAFAGALGFAAAVTLPAVAQPARVQVGTLNCSLSSAIGMVVGSQRNVNCLFKAEGAPDEAYTGTLTRVGLDVGVTAGGAIVWGVFASTNRYVGMLNGTYAGASAEATVAAGLGANVLVGGSNRTVALQPLSVQGQVGLNAAVGVSALDLHLAQ
jgi:hypothetical protein